MHTAVDIFDDIFHPYKINIFRLFLVLYLSLHIGDILNVIHTLCLKKNIHFWSEIKKQILNVVQIIYDNNPRSNIPL